MNHAPLSAGSPAAASSPSSDNAKRSASPGGWRLVTGALAIVVPLALVQALTHVDAVNPDAISYFTLTEFIHRGRWLQAVNTAWSPLYSLLLALVWPVFGATRDRMALAAHALNVILAGGLVCAAGVLTDEVRRLSARQQTTGAAASPLWVFSSVTAFVAWIALDLIGMSTITPDLLLAVIITLASALGLRAVRAPGWGVELAFGAALGLAFLSKTIALYFAVVQLGAYAWLSSREHSRIAGIARAIGAFLALSIPFVLALSLQRGHFTVGESGRLSLLWDVDGLSTSNFQGDSAHGVPLHPTRLVHRDPRIFEFGSPFLGVTYPISFDPGYWYDGVTPRLPIGAVASRIGRNVVDFLLRTIPLTAAFLLALALGQGRSLMNQYSLKLCLLLVLPSAFCLLLYHLTHVEPRYIAPFVLPLFVGVTVGPHHRVFSWLILMAFVAAAMTGFVVTGELRNRRPGRVDEGWARASANELLAAGFAPGQRVGTIGLAYNSYWAFLSGLRIAAEIPAADASQFWVLSRPEQACALVALRRRGVRAFVAYEPPELSSANWTRLKSGLAFLRLEDDRRDPRGTQPCRQ